MPYLIVVVVLAVVVYAVTAPLRAQRREGLEAQARAVTVGDLEAAREAKYREIRDAELDLRTGKLSEEDHRALDATLRAEAIDILRALDRAGGDGEGPPAGAPETTG